MIIQLQCNRNEFYKMNFYQYNCFIHIIIICYSYGEDQVKPCKVICDITDEIVCMNKAGELNNGICYRSITELTKPLKIGNDHHYY